MAIARSSKQSKSVGKSVFRIACALSFGLDEIKRAFQQVPDVEVLQFTKQSALEESIEPCEGLVVYSSHYSALLSRWALHQELKWIHFVTAGIDPLLTFPIPKGVIVSTSGQLWSGTVAEHALAMLLALTRGLHISLNSANKSDWGRELLIPQLRVIRDLKVLIVGYGAIGSEIGRRLRVFGPQVTGLARNRRVDDDVDVKEISELNSELSQSDVIFLTIPLTPDTADLISTYQLGLMKKSAILIDVSRGGVVNQAALVEALREKHIGCAGLDVFAQEPLALDHPLRSLPNVVLSPHIAGFGEKDIEEKLAMNIKDNLLDFLSGKIPRDAIEI
jgi:phosphoglycerate dehydrogenase-like enzyme